MRYIRRRLEKQVVRALPWQEFLEEL